MPNFAAVLKTEIVRLARKELRSEAESLKKSIASYRKEISTLKRRVEALERQQKRTVKAPTAVTLRESNDEIQLRFRPAGFAQHRKRLGISAREMGLLVEASPLSIYKWEKGQAKPRAKHLAAIARVRTTGKREVARRLEALAA